MAIYSRQSFSFYNSLLELDNLHGLSSITTMKRRSFKDIWSQVWVCFAQLEQEKKHVISGHLQQLACFREHFYQALFVFRRIKLNSCLSFWSDSVDSVSGGWYLWRKKRKRGVSLIIRAREGLEQASSCSCAHKSRFAYKSADKKSLDIIQHSNSTARSSISGGTFNVWLADIWSPNS